LHGNGTTAACGANTATQRQAAAAGCTNASAEMHGASRSLGTGSVASMQRQLATVADLAGADRDRHSATAAASSGT